MLLDSFWSAQGSRRGGRSKLRYLSAVTSVRKLSNVCYFDMRAVGCIPSTILLNNNVSVHSQLDNLVLMCVTFHYNFLEWPREFKKTSSDSRQIGHEIPPKSRITYGEPNYQYLDFRSSNCPWDSSENNISIIKLINFMLYPSTTLMVQLPETQLDKSVWQKNEPTFPGFYTVWIIFATTTVHYNVG